MSFGAIYCKTWWGDYKNIQHSIPHKPDCLYPPPVQDFINRVEADGGTVEAKDCVTNIILGMGYVELPASTVRFIERVEADGGVVEAVECI